MDGALPLLPDFSDFAIALLQQVAYFLAAVHLVPMELVQVVSRRTLVSSWLCTLEKTQNMKSICR
jgi:hypothetical protein